MNDLTVWSTRLEGHTALLEVSPYDSPLSSWIRDQLRRTLEQQPVDFENLAERLDSTSPVLPISAIDVISGIAKNFDSRNGDIGVDALLASTAVPPVFKAAHVDGGVYWDALFCQNPPLRELGRMKRDEIWVIQVTPWSRGFEPKKVADIMDRRNELSGNVAMAQEIYVIEKINEMVNALGEGEGKEDKRLRFPGEEGKEYKHIEIWVVEMSDEMHQHLDFASKMDRKPSFIQELMDHGEERAEELLGGRDKGSLGGRHLCSPAPSRIMPFLMQKGLWKMGSVPGDVRLAFGRMGEGPEPLLALHGITAQHRAFNMLARHLQYPDGMVALDLRGRGDSDKPPSGNYGLAAHAEDVIRTLDHLGIEKGVLAGHSSGAFVALYTALLYPDRTRALVLLDGGWPRPEEPSEPDEQVQEGLERAYNRLDMVFETPEDYLDYWFPDQNLTLEDLPPDLADYYLYDLERVDGGYTPKASREAAEENAESIFFESPTAAEMKGVRCPVALVRAAEGFFPGTDPLVSDEARNVMAEALDLRSERLLSGANHYTILLSEEYARQTADLIRDFLQQTR